MPAEPEPRVAYHRVGADATSPAGGRAGGRRAGPRAASLFVLAAALVCWAEARWRVIHSHARLALSRLRAVPIDGCHGSGTDPPQLRATFPLTRWDGDDAFWAAMPCPPSSYRVVVPPGALSPDDDCVAATVVTALMDDAGGGLTDPPPVVLSLRNPLVVFTDAGRVDAVLAARRRAGGGLDARTVVVGHEPACAPTAALLRRTREAMCAPRFADHAADPTARELRSPWRMLLSWSKLHWTLASTEIAAVRSPYYVWLDGGARGGSGGGGGGCPGGRGMMAAGLCRRLSLCPPIPRSPAHPEPTTTATTTRPPATTQTAPRRSAAPPTTRACACSRGRTRTDPGCGWRRPSP